MLNNETEDALRTVYRQAVSGLDRDAAGLPERVTGRLQRHRRRRRTVAAATLAPLALVAVALPASLHVLQGNAQATTIRLADYSLALPSSYSSATTSANACRPWAVFGYAPGNFTPASRPEEPEVEAATEQAGGCIDMSLTAPYTPGAPEAPIWATKPISTQPVQIDGLQGLAGTWTWISRGLVIRGVPTPSGSQQQEVLLTIPEAKGQVQELLVAATGISLAQLESIVTAGLTVPSSTSTSTGPATTSVTAPPITAPPTTVPATTVPTAPAATTALG